MDYPKLPGLTPDGRVYWNEEMGTIEARIPNGGYRSGHGPALLELPNGDLLCVWFAGSFEGNADVHIVCSRLEKDSGAWTEPVDVSGDPERSEQNPSLFYGPDGAAWCMYTAQLDRQAGKDNMQFTAVVRCQKSTDGGRTWGPYETVFPEEGTFCRQPIQVLSNGRWIFSNWLCTDSAEGLSGDPTAFRISDDQGKTWRTVMMPESHGHVHANVVELEPGHLVAFMRNREAYRIHRSESFDYGETWSEPKPTPLPNNNSSISAIKLQSGRVAIAYNPTCTPDPQPGKAAWPGLRCPVAVALSEDGGLTFPIIRWMERGEGYIGDENKTNNKQYEYPYLMQTKDGMIHLAYAAWTRDAMKYVRFTEEDVLGEKRERVGLYNPTAAQGCK
ncbi:MAG TPA: exo-alpha-sialidase [Candidatus Pelethomonas intestinigallinarum]|nr:exo-alpha-sialidase [Candidatus Pelethomonas intestinigallinarum]